LLEKNPLRRSASSAPSRPAPPATPRSAPSSKTPAPSFCRGSNSTRKTNRGSCAAVCPAPPPPPPCPCTNASPPAAAEIRGALRVKPRPGHARPRRPAPQNASPRSSCCLRPM
jgi:hypothetical protein